MYGPLLFLSSRFSSLWKARAAACATWAVGCFITVSAPPGSVMYIALWNKEEKRFMEFIISPRRRASERERAGQQKTPAARRGPEVTSERSLSPSLSWINELIRDPAAKRRHGEKSSCRLVAKIYR